ncbi:chromosomal replication initiator protein DnaA [Rhodoblastus acidophilus]|uniref:Chromosomal replication initiator protein DnaA n=1 Tax=Candidatus Rhodoblastus alkanivorans TaxID=2954117 RepID=A0ABS9Z1S1_9HYPH|nr:chromosomal replication initiator protein DnaA [Candidatus Rhodoblastus alkanivorans]MCI4678091.1 chromosomal replication initiator protein DnaA [Candidatus Rhodoblastus alkanivorans]MCI4681568.1 chromosomal replication initiator protein DnaA [Candidatus Rhodoblastus alkanivorans]MDI4642616.1 chromosomal replication initiator protein DnaA [Rhodoblastus acidophilus]
MSKAQLGMVNKDDRNGDGDAALWARFCERFRREVGDAIYVSWFKSLELETIVDGVAYLSVPTKFLRSWIQAHYLDKLRNTIAAEIPGVRDIALELRAAMRLPGTGLAERRGLDAARDPGAVEAKRAATTGKDQLKADSAGSFGGSSLDGRFRFSTFLVGPSNQLAIAAARQVGEGSSGAGTTFNPLYFFSNVGLGKTHLIQAIAHAGMEAGRRVIYLTAEKFMYGFVAALKRQNSMAFKDSLRSIDLLVIDDVQFLQGKTIQHEFCHTLNALIDSGRQVVIAGDRSPNELENLDERVKSRFAGGLCVEIQSLDEGLRRGILDARIQSIRTAHPAFDVTANVVSMVTKLIDTNGRDLDGAVNRLLAHTILAGAPLTLEAAEAAIRDLIRVKEPKKVKIEDIQKLVATHFNVSRADILSSRRTANVVRPRQIAMYLAKTMTLRSLPEIGRRFGGRDHTTVLHAVRKIEEMASKDMGLSQELDLLKRLLGD